MKLRIVCIAALGLAATLYLLSFVGWSAVLSAALAVGWGGFALLCAYCLLVFPVLGAAWFVLLPRAAHARLWVLIWARMVREAGGDLLPFSQLGGIVIGARAAALHGIPRSLAYGSVIVDITTELLAQIAYVALGIALLWLRASRSAALSPTLRTAIACGLVLLIAGGVTSLLLQRRGHRRMSALAARVFPKTVATTESIAGALDLIYASRARVAGSATLHLAGWLASALGAWIALALIGVRIDLGAVIALESLVCVARSAAVIIPSALGVQEAAYAMLMPVFGVPAEFGLALSLLKRARDIVLGVPPLLIWQMVESRRVLAGPAASP